MTGQAPAAHVLINKCSFNAKSSKGLYLYKLIIAFALLHDSTHPGAPLSPDTTGSPPYV